MLIFSEILTKHDFSQSDIKIYFTQYFRQYGKKKVLLLEILIFTRIWSKQVFKVISRKRPLPRNIDIYGDMGKNRFSV